MNSLENNVLQQTIEEEKLVDPAEAKRQKILQKKREYYYRTVDKAKENIRKSKYYHENKEQILKKLQDKRDYQKYHPEQCTWSCCKPQD